MSSTRSNFVNLALTALRVTVGYIMMIHGWQKWNILPEFQSNLAAMGVPYPEIMAYLAFAGEFLGGIGLIAGLLTPLAAFGVACTMAVAVFKVHWNNGLLAQDKGFEYPLTLMMVAIYFMFRGAGPISLDALFGKKKSI